MARSYMDTEQYEEAVRDYEKVNQTEKTTGKLWVYLFSYIYIYILTGPVWHTRMDFLFIHVDHKHLLKTAQLELKKSKRKDYYKVLGVGKNATEDEIKKAYRKRALMHHPGTPFWCSPRSADFIQFDFYLSNLYCTVSSFCRPSQRRNSRGAKGGGKEV